MGGAARRGLAQPGGWAGAASTRPGQPGALTPTCLVARGRRRSPAVGCRWNGAAGWPARLAASRAHVVWSMPHRRAPWRAVEARRRAARSATLQHPAPPAKASTTCSNRYCPSASTCRWIAATPPSVSNTRRPAVGLYQVAPRIPPVGMRAASRAQPGPSGLQHPRGPGNCSSRLRRWCASRQCSSTLDQRSPAPTSSKPRPGRLTVLQGDDVQKGQRAVLKALRSVRQQGEVQGADGVVGRAAAPVHLRCHRGRWPRRDNNSRQQVRRNRTLHAQRSRRRAATPAAGAPCACAWRCPCASLGHPPRWGTQTACSCDGVGATHCRRHSGYLLLTSSHPQAIAVKLQHSAPPPLPGLTRRCR